MDIYAVCSGFNILENNWRVFYSFCLRKIVKKKIGTVAEARRTCVFLEQLVGGVLLELEPWVDF